MYTLISAIGEPRGGDSRWAAVEIGNMPLATIFSTYSNVFAVLSNNFLDHNVSLSLADIREAHGASSATFNDFLAGLGNSALPTSDAIPELNTRYAKYADAFHAGYKVTPVHPTAAPDAELPPSERTWLRLTRRDTDYVLFKKSVLVVINGFIHQTDGDVNGVYVKEGNNSATLSRRAEIGLISFRELGQLTQVPITEEMLYKQKPEQRMRDRTFVNLGQDLTNKTVMLVLGGYLHLLDAKTFYRVGEQTVAIDFGNLPFYERYLESREVIDLSSLPIEKTNRNDSQVGVENFLSDEVITAYMTLSQSFFVILDNPFVFSSRLAVHEAHMPGMFISYQRPDYPMVAGYGRTMNYWYTYEDQQYSLTVTDSFKPNRVFNTVNAKAQQSIADSRLPNDPVRHSMGYFLLIGRDI